MKHGIPIESSDSSLEERLTSGLVELLPGGDENMTPSDAILNLSRLFYHLALEYSVGERTALSEAVDSVPEKLRATLMEDYVPATNPTFIETDTGQEIIHIMAAQTNLDPAVVAKDAEILEARAYMAQKIIDLARPSMPKVNSTALLEAIGVEAFFELHLAKVHDAFTQTPDEMWQY